MSRRRSRLDPASNGNTATNAPEPGSTAQSAARDLILIPAVKSIPIPTPARKLAPRAPNQIRYRTAFQTTISDVLRNRGWKETDQDLDWDLIWADASWIRDV